MNILHIFAQSGADGAFNQFLNNNPFILGLFLLIIGGVFIEIGRRGLKSGVAVDKFGVERTGGQGQFIAMLRILAGVMCIGFAIYRVFFG